MKQYRFNARYARKHIQFETQADSDEKAIENFVNALDKRQVVIKEDHFHIPTKMFIAYEEVENANAD
jgi:hypothetical protein